MNYIDILEEFLSCKTLKQQSDLRVIDLFAGCGGLSLGFEAAGFKVDGFEMNKDCCLTYSHNLKGSCENVKLDKEFVFQPADIVIGGPPCQPFSVGGKQLGKYDERDGFPIFLSCIEQTSPTVFVLENVRGLLYKNKVYFDSIINDLASLGYEIEYNIVNMVDYGVPQNRQRIVIVGWKKSIGVEFSMPRPFHKKYTAGDAIGDIIDTPQGEIKYLTESMDKYIKKYEIASKCKNPRDLDLNKSARTLTCRNLAGSTGDMHRINVGDKRRRMTVQEAARIQSFPNDFIFQGKETSIFNQIGNSVPPLFAYQLALAIKDSLGIEFSQKDLSFNEININAAYRTVTLQSKLDLYTHAIKNG